MRLVLVHGINNQGRTSSQIIEEWLGALSDVLSPADMSKVRQAEIVAPYYGDTLFEATSHESKAGPKPVAQSAVAAPAEEAQFYREALEDFAPAAGVTEADIQSAAELQTAVEMGLPHDRRLLALLRALEKVSPFRGELILRFLPQAFVYLHRAAVAADVETIVRPALQGEPCVVVAHSLGTIVTFKLLRAGENVCVPFYLTLGSPLSVKAVKNAIGPAFGRPDDVGSWLNGLDLDDAVTTGRALNETTFGPGIENIDDIDNGDHDAHDIGMYLRNHRVAQAIVRALSGVEAAPLA